MTRDEQRELLARAGAGELSAEDAARLLDACRRDPALLAELSRLTVVERLLAHSHLYRDDDTLAREVAARLRESVSAVTPVRPRRFRWGWAAGFVLCLGALSFWALRPGPVAARVVRIESATWPAGQFMPAVGEPLRAGRLRIESGFMEIAFARGATVILEGPAEFEVRGPLHAVLHRGRAVTRVAPGARGFILDGPRGRLVDLGTEFGVNVGAKGDMEVHVIEGLVEATPRGENQSVQLTVNQAARLTDRSLERITADASGFVTDLPPESQGAIGHLHWAFDEGRGGVSLNLGAGLGQPRAAASLRSFSAGGTGPQWIAGQFGGALAFDGRDDFVECDFPGIPGAQPRTVAFWVKVPRAFQTNEGYAILNWGAFGSPGTAWQISINPDVASGPVGHLRVGVHPGFVIGAIDLRDDRWHHCAVVMYGGHRADTGTHILLYVDGELDPAARKKVTQIDTDIAGTAARSIWIGRNLAYRGKWSVVQGGPFFRGAVDEVFVLNAALDQEQIRSLLKYNRLPSAP
jgi:hypothetical protein